MQKNFILTLLVLVLSAGILAVTLLQLDPYGPQRVIARSAFLLGAFGTVTSFFTFVFFFGTEFFSGFTAGTKAYMNALRRGSLCGLFVSINFLLHMHNLFGLLEATLLAFFLVLVEFIAVTN